ncbi:hypothetical protein ACOMHN_056025 [Nucella lapillus]
MVSEIKSRAEQSFLQCPSVPIPSPGTADRGLEEAAGRPGLQQHPDWGPRGGHGAHPEKCQPLRPSLPVAARDAAGRHPSPPQTAVPAVGATGGHPTGGAADQRV